MSQCIKAWNLAAAEPSLIHTHGSTAEKTLLKSHTCLYLALLSFINHRPFKNGEKVQRIME
jgi:hypothetical protein